MGPHQFGVDERRKDHENDLTGSKLMICQKWRHYGTPITRPEMVVLSRTWTIRQVDFTSKFDEDLTNVLDQMVAL